MSLDMWDVTEPASVAEYQRIARAAVDAVLARGRVPLLVGGSGLYVRAVLEQFEFPGTDAGAPGTSSRPSSPRSGRSRCMLGWPRATPTRPRGSCPATAGASSEPSKSCS